MQLTHRVFALVIALVLSVGSVTSAFAQDDEADATPEVEINQVINLGDDDADAPTSGTPEAAVPGFGEEVVIVDPVTGDDVAAVTVTDVVEDFDEYARYYNPEDGYTYVAVEMTVENLIANDRLDFYSYDFSIATADGFVFWPSYVEVDEDSEFTPLEDEAILGGESISGWIFIAVPEDAELEGIYFNAYGILRVATLGEASADRPAIGDSVTLVDAEGTETAEITVEDVIVPFEDYGQYPPVEGSEYIAVELTIDNLISNDRIDFYSYDYSLVTVDGEAIPPAYVYLDEDSDITILDNVEILGDESVTGYIVYMVPEGTELDGLYFYQYDRVLLLADLSA